MICSQETEIIYAPEGQEWWNDDHFILPIGDRIEYIYISHTLLYIYIEGFVENTRRRRKEKEREMDKKTSRNKKERRRDVERKKRGVIK